MSQTKDKPATHLPRTPLDRNASETPAFEHTHSIQGSSFIDVLEFNTSAGQDTRQFYTVKEELLRNESAEELAFLR